MRNWVREWALFKGVEYGSGQSGMGPPVILSLFSTHKVFFVITKRIKNTGDLLGNGNHELFLKILL